MLGKQAEEQRTESKGTDDALITAGPRDPAGPLDGSTPYGGRLAFLIDMTNEGFPPGSAGANGHVSRRSLAAGGGGEDGSDNQQLKPSIDFSSDVLILSGRTPRLYIDTGGNITQAIEASVNDVAGGNGTRTRGLILDGTINVTKDEDARCYLFPDKPSTLAQIRQLFDGKIRRQP